MPLLSATPLSHPLPPILILLYGQPSKRQTQNPLRPAMCPPAPPPPSYPFQGSASSFSICLHLSISVSLFAPNERENRSRKDNQAKMKSLFSRSATISDDQRRSSLLSKATEKLILDSKEKIEYYRTIMQELDFWRRFGSAGKRYNFF